MGIDPNDPDPEAVLERREQRVSGQGHAAVAGALAIAAVSLSGLSLLVAVGAVDTRGLLPVFSVAGLGALGGAWLNGTLIERVADPKRWFRRVVGGVLVFAATLSAAAVVVGLATESLRLLAILFGVAWASGVAVTWRFR
ncbi:hypothetical protein BRC97_11100 [Halobacteriales archaeon QS_6_71_20]|nr:MAG: hypothetical protein BRC97_11100 [Halobacteriales archaeon QS_6_71_20]